MFPATRDSEARPARGGKDGPPLARRGAGIIMPPLPSAGPGAARMARATGPGGPCRGPGRVRVTGTVTVTGRGIPAAGRASESRPPGRQNDRASGRGHPTPMIPARAIDWSLTVTAALEHDRIGLPAAADPSHRDGNVEPGCPQKSALSLRQHFEWQHCGPCRTAIRFAAASP